jgi:hypothetical protein
MRPGEGVPPPVPGAASKEDRNKAFKIPLLGRAGSKKQKKSSCAGPEELSATLAPERLNATGPSTGGCVELFNLPVCCGLHGVIDSFLTEFLVLLKWFCGDSRRRLSSSYNMYCAEHICTLQ